MPETVKSSWHCNVDDAMQAFDLGVQEVHFQSWGDNVQKLSSVAFDLAGINPKQVVVKLPCTLEGIQTAALLRDANIRCVIEAIKIPNHGVYLGQSLQYARFHLWFISLFNPIIPPHIPLSPGFRSLGSAAVLRLSWQGLWERNMRLPT